MKLAEIAPFYEEEMIKRRTLLTELRRAFRNAPSEKRCMLRFEITRNEQVYKQARALEELCRRYYEPDFWRPPDFTMNGEI